MLLWETKLNYSSCLSKVKDSTDDLSSFTLRLIASFSHTELTSASVVALHRSIGNSPRLRADQG